MYAKIYTPLWAQESGGKLWNFIAVSTYEGAVMKVENCISHCGHVHGSLFLVRVARHSVMHSKQNICAHES